MDEFEVIFAQQAKKDIKRLDKTEQNRILERIEWLGVNILQIPLSPLKGRKWQGMYKLRVGNYRVIYTLDLPRRQLNILKVGHRRDVYKP